MNKTPIDDLFLEIERLMSAISTTIEGATSQVEVRFNPNGKGRNDEPVDDYLARSWCVSAVDASRFEGTGATIEMALMELKKKLEEKFALEIEKDEKKIQAANERIALLKGLKEKALSEAARGKPAEKWLDKSETEHVAGFGVFDDMPDHK